MPVIDRLIEDLVAERLQIDAAIEALRGHQNGPRAPAHAPKRRISAAHLRALQRGHKKWQAKKKKR